MNVPLDLTEAFVEDFQLLEDELRRVRESGNETTAVDQAELQQQLQAQSERLSQGDQEMASLARDLAKADQRAEGFEHDLLDKAEQLGKAFERVERLKRENQKLSEQIAVVTAERDECAAQNKASESSPAEPPSRGSPELVDRLQSEIQRLKQTVQNFPDSWQTVLADYENLKIDLRNLRKAEQSWEAEKLDLQRELYRCKFEDK